MEVINLGNSIILKLVISHHCERNFHMEIIRW